MSAQTIDAVVLGASPTGLYALRELAAGGLSVALADFADGCAFGSRFVRNRERRFRGDSEGIEAWLGQIAGRQQALPVLVPTSDVFIEFLIQRHERLSKRFRFADCYRGPAQELLDKAMFHALCGRHGMATPGVWLAEGQDELLALSETMPYPCILKPVLIHRARGFLKGKKVLLARDRAEYEAHARSVPQASGAWLVQEIIPGPESEITLFAGCVDSGGVLRQPFTARKLRQYPAGFGSASLVSSAPCAETLALTAGFLDRIGFRGICGAEFKRDPRDGVLKIIEINPRPTLWFQITHDAGKRVVETLVRDLLGGDRPPETPQSESVVWRYGLKDLASRRFYSRSSADFIFPAPDVSSADGMTEQSWPVFDAGDPLPALLEPLGYLRKARGRRG